MTRIVNRLSCWMPVLIWAGLIFYLSHIPNLNSGLGTWDFILRKGAHMTEYAILNFLLVRALKGTSTLSIRSILTTGFIGALLYAISDEIHQTFVVGRTGSPVDVLIDGVGASLTLLWYRSRRYDA